MREPRFDTVGRVEFVGEDTARDIVVHRNSAGMVCAFHSPLDKGAVSCTICEKGARVYLVTDEEQRRGW